MRTELRREKLRIVCLLTQHYEDKTEYLSQEIDVSYQDWCELPTVRAVTLSALKEMKERDSRITVEDSELDHLDAEYGPGGGLWVNISIPLMMFEDLGMEMDERLNLDSVCIGHAIMRYGERQLHEVADIVIEITAEVYLQ